MNKYQREVMREARRIAAAYGGDVALVANHPHSKLVCRCRGGRSVMPIAGTPKNRDTARFDKRRDVRRVFREMAGE